MIGRALKHVVGAAFPHLLLIRRMDHPDRRIALTFDDGPHPEHTPRILEILAHVGIPATFFLQGSEVARFPHLVRTIHASGHQIGNHGYAHLDVYQCSTCTYISDVVRTQTALEDAIGERFDKIFRPPFGRISMSSFILLTCAGYRFVLWSIDSQDSFINDSNRLNKYIDEMNISPGDILLFHDDYAHTVFALPTIIESLRQRSFRFCRISELL